MELTGKVLLFKKRHRPVLKSITGTWNRDSKPEYVTTLESTVFSMAQVMTAMSDVLAEHKKQILHCEHEIIELMMEMEEQRTLFRRTLTSLLNERQAASSAVAAEVPSSDLAY